MCHVSVYTIFHYCLFCGSICNISVLVTCRRVNCFAFWMKRTCGIVQNSPIAMIYYIIFHKSSLIVIADNEAIFVAKFLSMNAYPCFCASFLHNFSMSLFTFLFFVLFPFLLFSIFIWSYSYGRLSARDNIFFQRISVGVVNWASLVYHHNCTFDTFHICKLCVSCISLKISTNSQTPKIEISWIRSTCVPA